AQLLEANEQLVLAALRAQGEADTAAHALVDMAQTSQHDALTGLANRTLLHERLSRSLGFARRRGSHLALLFLDLNDFKEVNDALGHAVGDEVLKVAAERLSSCVRETDTVSRHGGDEFLILLSEIADTADAARIAEKMIAALAAPCRVKDHVLRLNASIGVSVYPEDGTEAQELIGSADAAMYRAKNEGAGSFVFRGSGVDAERLVNQPTLASLRRPLTRHEVAISEHERQLGQMQEANAGLVIAALGAQERQAAAEQAQKKQREFLGMLAHELRSPLTPIRNAAAAMGHVHNAEAALPKMQAIIERQVVHMARLVDDLLDVSRIDTGKLRLERVLVDVAEVVDEAVDGSRPAMDARLQRFQAQMPTNPLRVHGDPGRLVQALSNVLNNASKYTPDAGAIELGVEADGDHVVLSVSDNGIGIPASTLTTIFDPFTQGAAAVNFNGGGLGIGLTVVRELVEAHGGSVSAESEGSGLGSRFVIRLPLAGHGSSA
ncbi:MAG: diguanylate cyclase, partial [Pseudomonadota bacterium]|nr:diguanylate cyclase [Pseudomonadota bacterium]